MASFMAALVNFLNPMTLLLTFAGCLVGMVLGAVPGLAGGTAITVLLPMTYAMDPLMAMAMLMGIYVGGESGGYIGSILLGIPGTASNVATVYDGYEMTKKGQVTRALSIATISNFMGTLPSLLIAMVACPVIASLAVKMGPWEYFSLAFMAITLVVTLSRGNMLRGFIGAALGLLLTQIGYSPISATPRFSFGNYYLSGGFSLLAVLIGVFAGSMIMITYANAKKEKPVKFDQKIEKFKFPGQAIIQNAVTIVRSFFIGLFIGFLPGMGPSLSNVVSYSTAKTASKHPEEFGTGCDEGLFAPEVANNASIGGAIIPMVALGIPGDGTTVLLLSALTIQGINAGPLLQKNNPTLVSMIFVAGILAALFALVIQIAGIRLLPQILKVPYHYLYPAILIISFMGVYASNTNMFAVFSILGFTLLGIWLAYAEIPITPFVLSYVLGTTLETNFRNAISYAGGDWTSFFKRPVSCVMLLFAIGSVLLPLIKSPKGRATS
ncbi:MAG: tripartite tricarboxylate transporter permease [Lachnospiraceae bacterium]|nr:tripartite tricarboxylate transporter permease [Lachnospiraceae bacterium]